ncbi:phosphoribosylformylglycinamidine synthase [Macrosteles quadrilineatus]|uniref:phosphoribosylformylglycinamidine synthase n=1 Tax=Macrosteles quadrilineatus TaxID=74068 RepID=UPI0023E10865|nr:phosphoribosylformylglycinamidine synthase [Macrosteles quadrilineatus]
MVVLHFYREPGLSDGSLSRKLRDLKALSSLVESLRTELCYNVEVTEPLNETQEGQLRWVLSAPLKPSGLQSEPHLHGQRLSSLLVEIGPRLNFCTAFSSNAVSICRSIGLTGVTRLEVSTRYLIYWKLEGLDISRTLENQLVGALHDRMTECRYLEPIQSFDHGIVPEPWFSVDVMGKGRKALEEVNAKLGLAFDDWDLEFYTELFSQKLKRNPTSVECFDLAQSNSEHSRHWFFKGKMIINQKEMPDSLLDMIFKTQDSTNQNNVIKFSDNSSAIQGYELERLRPSAVDTASKFITSRGLTHIAFTAETHNFPTGVAPFSGATTGTGGRIRDVQGVGRGGHCIAGTAGYCVGNLLIPDYQQPWEDAGAEYPPNLASPLEILVEASNGASDYGNKFGEPVVCGFTRAFGLSDATGQRREWIKPIMFSGGVGAVEAGLVDKEPPEKGMEVVKVGGPVYRIGVGGGSASSVQVQGDNQSELDFGAVQRGDAEMEQKLNRVIRACVENPGGNPICSIHDQGAGGNGNVLKELVEPAGAVIFSKHFTLGDPSISTLELWGAEYQENDALLCRPDHADLLRQIAARERCPVNFVGTVTGNGRVVLSEEENPDPSKYLDSNHNSETENHPFNLDLELVLGKMPQKEYVMERQPVVVQALNLPPALTVLAALQRVLRLTSVGSKRFLTNKVDRCVTGLVAQQQCVGPLHTPLSDVAVTALSHFSTEGVATAIGEQPIKGLVDCAAGARMAVAESLTNLVFARITDIQDVKCSGNWMWAAKLPGEGAALYDACQAMCQLMCQLGIAVDGGKDSLSMAARVGTDTVKAPGALVVSSYAPCPDISQVVTPDLKAPGAGCLVLVDLSGRARLGGSALAQCYSQLGDTPPDVDDPQLLKRAFACTQKLIGERAVLSGHDVSDGGLVTCLLEMCFAGVVGATVDVQQRCRGAETPLHALFAEELGWVLEVEKAKVKHVQEVFRDNNVPCLYLGESGSRGMSSKIVIRDGAEVLLDETVWSLMRLWEETSYHLEKRQANPDCVKAEFESLASRTGPQYHLTFDPTPAKPLAQGPRVAVIREEGSNGDREMAASLFMAGFETWDVTMQDLLDKKVTVDHFQGVVFPGGFSYADVLGSAKGWAASLLFHPSLKAQLESFTRRTDTFSLGVCNGCQLMSLLGWVGLPESSAKPDVVLDHNVSGRFECRWSTVRVETSAAIHLRGMAGSVLGVWVAHGEGRFTLREPKVLEQLEQRNCLALKYVDDNSEPTERYPFNPNGSVGGVAGVCSQDGRHLALMPHPERCTLSWQQPYVPPQWHNLPAAPWLTLFHNMYKWAVEQH